MKKIIIVIMLLSLVGCSVFSRRTEQPVVVQKEYVVRIPPAELLVIPKKVEKNFDPDTAMQSDVAKLILQYEERMLILENQLIGIGKFFATEIAK